MGRRLRRGAAALLAVVGLGACDAGTVTVAFRPEAGDLQRYRYEITGTVRQELDGADPVVNQLDLELEVDEEVLSAADDGTVAARLRVRRPGAPAETVDVRLDGAGGLAGIDLGADAGPSELGVLDQVLSVPALPSEPVAPGERWDIEGAGVDGEGRLRRLGIVDGHEVAVVDTAAEHDLDEDLTSSGSTVHVAGTVRATSQSAYDIADGTVRRARTTARGSVDLVVNPPTGVAGTPVSGTVTYDVRVVVTRR